MVRTLTFTQRKGIRIAGSCERRVAGSGTSPPRGRAYRPESSAVISETLAFASPNSIAVFGS